LRAWLHGSRSLGLSSGTPRVHVIDLVDQVAGESCTLGTHEPRTLGRKPSPHSETHDSSTRAEARLAFLIAYPWAAGLVAAACGVLWRWRGRSIAAITALCWLLYGGYGGYEFLMKTRVLCSGECNIRVDLLLIYPVLTILTLWSVVTTLRASAAQAE
jgi:hypothetical protein